MDEWKGTTGRPGGRPIIHKSNHTTIQHSPLRCFGLPGIKFDDSLFISDGLDLIAGRDPHDDTFERFFVQG